MKRLRVILLFLLLGAVVNVAVAWGCALTVSLKGTSLISGLFYSNVESWHLMRSEAFGSNTYISVHQKFQYDDETLELLEEEYRDRRIENIKPRWGSMEVTTTLYQSLPGLGLPVTPETQIAMETRSFESRGWPMRSLWCLRKIGVFDGSVITYFGSRSFITIPFLPEYNWGPRGLPLYPIWIGFVVNTLFYAAALWLLFTGTLVLQHMIRLKRGRCVKCAYDLRGLDHESCPECGEEIRKANPA